MNVDESDYYEVWVDASKGVAVLTWKKDVGLKECQQGINVLFEIIKANRTGKCLINTSQRAHLSAEAEEWEISRLQDEGNTFVPMGFQLALVMSEKRYEELIHEYSLNRVCKINLPITINYFTQQEEAMDWLMDESNAHS
jgi:hypothetical protein